MSRTLRLLILLLSASALTASAQDPQLSQFHAAAQYLNPALTGNTFQDRIALNYRLQWPGVQPGYETYALSYDHRFAGANSGIGGMVIRDKAGTYGLSFTMAALSYSYEARIDRRKALRFGARFGYTSRSVSPDGYLFADQVIRDNAPTSVEENLVPTTGYLDVAAGGLYYSEQFWAGVSFAHINRPNQSLMIDGVSVLPVRSTIHGGYRFPLDGRRFDRSETIMTLTTQYKAQGKWDQLDVGGYIEYSKVSAGIWYRGIPLGKAYKPGYGNNESVVLMAGFETDFQLRFAYSYDVTISKLTLKSGGAHEISVIYEWPRKAKSRKYKLVPCPKF